MLLRCVFWPMLLCVDMVEMVDVEGGLLRTCVRTWGIRLIKRNHLDTPWCNQKELPALLPDDSSH